MRSPVGGRSEVTLLLGQVRCNLSGLRALGPYQQPANYKHATIRPSLLLNNTTPHCPLSRPKAADRDFSSFSSLSLSLSQRHYIGANSHLLQVPALHSSPFLDARPFSLACLPPRNHWANETDMKRFSMVVNIAVEAVEHRAGGLYLGREW